MSTYALEYAKALFELSKTYEMKEEILEDLRASLDIFKDSISSFFLYPEIKKEDKKKIIDNSYKDGLFKNFLKVLIDNDRFNSISEIKDEYEKLLLEEKNSRKVLVYSKLPLKDEYLKSLKEILKKKMSKDVILDNRIDESIIGGIKIFYDSKEIDMTVNTKLESLVDNLKE